MENKRYTYYERKNEHIVTSMVNAKITDSFDYYSLHNQLFFICVF